MARNHVRVWSRSAAATKQVNRCAVFGAASLRPRDADGFFRQHEGSVLRGRAATDSWVCVNGVARRAVRDRPVR